ncbi:MAG: TAXI family TRAP transporter solute-binding subunit [Pseudomonadota bacterium]
MMKKPFVIATLTLIASANIAHADTIKIGAASPAGEYTNTIVPALSDALQEYGYTAVAEISAGSQENIDKVWSGELPAGLSQLDVAALNMAGERPSSAQGNLILMGRFAPEALFCVAKKGGQVTSYDDLTATLKPGLKVSVGKIGSGTARTFQYLMTLEPELSQVELLQEGAPEIQLNRLLSGERDLVCFVMMPNLKNDLIKTIVGHKELMFINIDKPVFTKAQVGDVQVYDLMEVPVSKCFFCWGAKKVKTLVTWVGVVVNEDLTDKKLLSALAKIALKDNFLPKNSLAAKATELFEKFKSKVTELF